MRFFFRSPDPARRKNSAGAAEAGLYQKQTETEEKIQKGHGKQQFSMALYAFDCEFVSD